jgi:hypothetical protein
MRWSNDRLGGQNTKSSILIGGEKRLEDRPSEPLHVGSAHHIVSGTISNLPLGRSVELFPKCRARAIRANTSLQFSDARLADGSNLAYIFNTGYSSLGYLLIRSDCTVRRTYGTRL